MQPRRAILFFALLLGLAAISASITPRSNQEASDSRPPTIRPGDREPSGRVFRRRFDARRLDARRPPATRSVRRGAHVIVTVEVPRPGQVTLDGLGLVAPAERRTPAVFDLIAERPGRYGVVYERVEGRRVRAGTLEVRR